ncbi:MAG: galactose mutarotase [Clostridia bacterium]|nr:galactose mutarotase [Clostridia bacterium]
MSLKQERFGYDKQGNPVTRLILMNATGCRASLLDFGATIQELWVPDCNGELADVVLGYPDMTGYLSATNPRHGATIGRVANRIAQGRFTLGGQVIELAKNKDPNHMHGGFVSFDKKLWQAEVLSDGDEPAVRFTLVSEDGEEGYPGNLTTHLTYTLTTDNALRLDYEAVSDRPTIINLTNHVYFNLRGHAAGVIDEQILTIHADQFTAIDETCYPTGGIRPVAGTALDFTLPKPIGQDIDSPDSQMAYAHGYDHNFVLRGYQGRQADPVLFACALVEDPLTGRTMAVETTSPGVQFYTANNMRPGEPGKDGANYQVRGSYCLETQHFPDAVHHESFPSVVYAAGEIFRHTTVYRFGVSRTT